MLFAGGVLPSSGSGGRRRSDAFGGLRGLAVFCRTRSPFPCLKVAYEGPSPRLQPHTLVALVNPVPEPSYHLVQEIQPGH
jgi:hypothetical protein